MLGVLYGAKAECDLAKPQNYWINNEEEELVYVCKMKINANNISCVPCLSKCHTALKKNRKKCLKNLTQIFLFLLW